jgi:hypothetical protein
MPTVCPRHHGQQGGATLLDGGKHMVPAQGVEGILPVNLQGHAARISRYACVQGVADNRPLLTNRLQPVAVPCCVRRQGRRPGSRARRACTRLSDDNYADATRGL